MGNPLQTRLSRAQLYLIGFSSIAVASSIGMYYVFTVSLWILPFVSAEAFFAIAYNLEAFGKRFHNMVVFCLSWGSIPFVTGYFVNSLSLSPPILLISIAIALLTYVQRTLSIQTRTVRRVLPAPVRSLDLSDGSKIVVSEKDLIGPAEKSLKALSVVIFLFAIALLLQRF